jgi:hypothetical protein
MFNIMISYLSVSFVFIGILFYVLKGSPSGWEDEHSFPAATKK